MKFKKVYYYSLNDAYEILTSDLYLPLDMADDFLELLIGDMNSVLDYYPHTSYIEVVEEEISVDADVKKLWNLMSSRYYDHILFKCDVENIEFAEVPDEIKPIIAKAFGNILVQIERTYSKYKKLLTLYTAQASNLMKQLESQTILNGSASNTGLHKENETPQNVGDYSTDTYATRVARDTNSSVHDATTTTKTDKDTAIMRLKEIQDNYRNVLSDWCDMLERCFGEEIEGE